LDLDDFLSKISVYAIPVLLAVSLHEVAQGWTAWRCGDRTPRRLGRLSLNPLKHVDPAGTLILPALLLSLRLPFFGWGRAMPPMTAALAHPRRASMLIGLAGLASNLAMAALWSAALAGALALRARSGGPSSNWSILMLDNWLILMAEAGIVTNVFMGFFNLLPLPPLDGGRILAAVLPQRAAAMIGRAQPFGVLVVIGLTATRGFGWMFNPAYQAIRLLLNAGGA
jgi:Zn-dependent protease